MSDILEIGKPKVHSNGYFPSKPIAQLHEFYLTGEIGPADDYVEWFDAIRHATENDTIKIYINSHGGDLFTAIQFMRVLAETNAAVICSVEGSCMSAATMVFLCADKFEVTPHSVFMFHNYSGGTIGKGGEMIDQLQHERKWSERLMREIYSGFLTQEEIKSMLDNKDFWMDGEEVVKRLSDKIDSTEKQKKTPTKTPKPKAAAKPRARPVARKRST
jgi:ATP-dependent protease ClpP protease subunit